MTAPNFGGMGTPVPSSGGIRGTGLTWGDILKFGGQALGGYVDYRQGQSAQQLSAQQFAEQLAFQKEQAKQQAILQREVAAQQQGQFDKTYGLQANTQAMGTADRINRAPLADKGQFLALNAAPPQPFQPRDYTHTGMPIPGNSPVGGAQAQVAANNAAAMNYKKGDGGVDTETLRLILSRLSASQAPKPPASPAPTTTIGHWQVPT